MHVATFDGLNKIINMTSGSTTVDVKRDLYSSWKQWILSGNANYQQAFRTIAGDPIGVDVNVGAYFFLRNDLGWRIRPAEVNHEVKFDGNLYPEDSSLPMFVPTTGTFTVLAVVERSSLTQATSVDPDKIWKHNLGFSGSFAQKTDKIYEHINRGLIR